MKRLSVFAVLIPACVAFSLLLDAAIPQVPSGTWSSTAGSPSAPRAGATAVQLIDGRVLVAGGVSVDGSNSAVVTGTAEVFGDDNAFTAVAPMAVARAWYAAVRLNDGRVLVTGGVTPDGTETTTAEIYDPASNAWSSVGTMDGARSRHTASLLPDGRVLIAGGTSLEIFDPTTSSFSFAGLLIPARRDHSAAVLRDGRVVIAGGSSADGVLALVDVYDVATGLLPAGELAVARARCTATTLLDGRVLFAGGAGADGDLTSLELYDPASGALLSSPSTLTVPRSGHQAFLLPANNSVLLVGGTSSGAAVASADLFLAWRQENSVRATGALSAARAHAAGAPTAREGVLLLTGGADAQTVHASAELYGFATIKTDKDDYRPGAVVTITGSGWQPGETVRLRLQESPQNHDDLVLTAVADEAGNIVNSEFSPEEHHLGVRFYLTATGAGSEAQTTFTDDRVTNMIDATPDAGLEAVVINAGTSTVVSYKITDPNAPAGDRNGCNAGGASATVTVNLSVPVGVSSSATSLLFTGCDVPQGVTFSSTTPGTYLISVASVSGGRPGSMWDTAPASFNLVVNSGDTTPPAQPGVDLVPTYVTGANQHAVQTTISGEAGATVSGSVISTGGGPAVALSGTIPGGGVLTLSLNLSSLADGTLTASATLTDGAGNASTPGTDTAVKDTLAPNAPSTPDLDAASDSGASQTDDTTNDATPSFSGTAETGSMVKIYGGGVEVGSGVATGGVYNITATATADGIHSFTARATDAAGNESAASASLVVTIDTVAPDAPSLPDLISSADSGISSTDNITNVNPPTIAGAAEAGSTVTLFLDGAELNAVPAPAGSYNVTTSPLSDGTHGIAAKATDLAGNVSNLSDVLTVTIDTVAPAPPSTPDLDAASDSGLLSTDNITNINSPSFAATAEVGAVVTILSDAVVMGSNVSSATGCHVVANTLADGPHAITATATDVAGNTSSPSGALLIVVDTVAPSAPVVDIQPVFVNLANQTAVAIHVSGEPDAVVNGAVTSSGGGGSVALSGSISSSGILVLVANLAGLPDGTVTAGATLTDVAGNCSPAGTDSTLKDTVAPVITLTSPADGDIYTLNQVVQAAYSCADPGGSGVSSCVGTVAPGAAVATAGVGGKSFTVEATDVAGNAAALTHTYTVQFGVCVLFDQTKAHRSGSTIPVKLFLCDASGTNVSAAGIVVTATQLQRLGNAATSEIEDAGQANPEWNFRFDPTLGPGGGYIFNLSTKGLVTGTWKLSFTAGADPVPHYVTFGVR